MPAVDTAGWSKVHAFFDHDDLVAKIQLEDDTYIIEVCGLFGILLQLISQKFVKVSNSPKFICSHRNHIYPNQKIIP